MNIIFFLFLKDTLFGAHGVPAIAASALELLRVSILDTHHKLKHIFADWDFISKIIRLNMKNCQFIVLILYQNS